MLIHAQSELYDTNLKELATLGRFLTLNDPNGQGFLKRYEMLDGNSCLDLMINDPFSVSQCLDKISN